MNAFWSWWVMVLVVFNFGLTFFLFLWAPRAKIPTLDDGTTGHTWSGGALREGARRLPRWWLLLSFALYVAAAVYLVLYPGFGSNPGALRWSAHQELAETSAANAARQAPQAARLAALSISELAGDADAARLGKRLFSDNCAACHGKDGHGSQIVGAPNLTDGDWLYGGDEETILASISDGRGGVMPPWEALGAATVHDLTQRVLALSGQAHDQEAAARAADTFAGVCAACHGEDATGTPALGAPNLTDQTWLYGGTAAAIERSINGGRQGAMPAWSSRLAPEEIRLLAAYVIGLGKASGQ